MLARIFGRLFRFGEYGRHRQELRQELKDEVMLRREIARGPDGGQRSQLERDLMACEDEEE